MGIIGAHHTSWTVRDTERSIAFYRDLLGFELIVDRPAVTLEYFRAIIGFPDAVVHNALLRIPGTNHLLELNGYKHPPGQPQQTAPNNPATGHICYMVDDLRAMYPHLQAAGVEFISPPIYLDQGPNKGGWALYMKDPDGIVVELLQMAPK
jgi:catechol 2,3-dioxygenase-like lactoylglutathione lyase family enzyme